MRIALVAGEASGDLLGAGLVTALRRQFPDAQFAGVCGPNMRAAGVVAWHDSKQLSLMGLAEVLRHLPRLLRLRHELRNRLLEWKPDVFIGIDAPDFNLGLERKLKQAGIRTVHYVSPSVWAWREGRAAKLGRSADLVLCLFPMEPPIYQRHGIPAKFVGHPLADAFADHPDMGAARNALGVAADAPILAMLPGSRLGEVRRLLPTFISAANLLAARLPGLQVLLPAANDECRRLIDGLLETNLLTNLHVVEGRAHEVMVAANVVLLASGTAALETMLAKRPMVVAYRISALTYHLVMSLGMMKVNRYSLPNVLANEPIVTELMQHDCTPEKLFDALLPLFGESEEVASLSPRYLAIHQRLRGGGSDSAAAAVAELLASR